LDWIIKKYKLLNIANILKSITQNYNPYQFTNPYNVYILNFNILNFPGAIPWQGWGRILQLTYFLLMRRKITAGAILFHPRGGIRARCTRENSKWLNAFGCGNTSKGTKTILLEKSVFLRNVATSQSPPVTLVLQVCMKLNFKLVMFATEINLLLVKIKCHYLTRLTLMNVICIGILCEIL